VTIFCADFLEILEVAVSTGPMGFYRDYFLCTDYRLCGSQRRSECFWNQRNISCLCRQSNYNPLVVHPTIIHRADYIVLTAVMKEWQNITW